MRPVILNGIGDIVTRPDLLDRCMVLQLPMIPESKRRQESDLDRQFEEARPRILGALLDAAAVALRDYGSVKLPSLPRMADFAIWGAAAEPAHSKTAIFLNAYQGNRANLNQIAIDTSIIGPAILQIMNGQSRWSGLLADLLEELNSKVAESVRKSKSWPSIPRQLKAELTRLSPNLRLIGIQVTFPKRTNRGILVELEQAAISSALSSPSAPENKTNELGRDDAGEDEIASSLASSPYKSFHIIASDESDDSDDKNASNVVEEIEL